MKNVTKNFLTTTLCLVSLGSLCIPAASFESWNYRYHAEYAFHPYLIYRNEGACMDEWSYSFNNAIIRYKLEELNPRFFSPEVVYYTFSKDKSYITELSATHDESTLFTKDLYVPKKIDGLTVKITENTNVYRYENLECVHLPEDCYQNDYEKEAAVSAFVKVGISRENIKFYSTPDDFSLGFEN